MATAFKLGLQELAPLQLVFVGTFVSALFFVIANTLTTNRSLAGWRVRPAHLKQAALLGLINPTLYYVVLFEAYHRLPAQIAQPLNYTWAITLALLAIPVLGQKLTTRMLLGILVSYTGVLILLAPANLLVADSTSSFAFNGVGIALALFSTLLWAGYWLMNTRSQAPPLTTMTYSFLFALPLLAIVCAMGPGWPSLNRHTLFFGGWVGLIEMGLTFLLWQRALRLTAHAGRLSQLIFLSPFISLILINHYLHESVRSNSVIACIVIVAGLLVSGPLSPTKSSGSTV